MWSSPSRSHQAARELLADTYEQLGYGSENGTWRCAFLSGAYELRHGNFGTPVTPVSPDVLAQLTAEQLFDALAIRVDGPRCWNEHITLDVDLTDIGIRYRLTLHNGVLIYTTVAQTTAADAVLHLPTAALPAVATGAADPAALTAAGATDRRRPGSAREVAGGTGRTRPRLRHRHPSRPVARTSSSRLERVPRIMRAGCGRPGACCIVMI